MPSYTSNRTKVELKPELSAKKFKEHYTSNRTKVELKLGSFSLHLKIDPNFQSNQSGIETKNK